VPDTSTRFPAMMAHSRLSLAELILLAERLDRIDSYMLSDEGVMLRIDGRDHAFAPGEARPYLELLLRNGAKPVPEESGAA
jgi:hypothetical protein